MTNSYFKDGATLKKNFVYLIDKPNNVEKFMSNTYKSTQICVKYNAIIIGNCIFSMKEIFVYFIFYILYYRIYDFF